MNIKRISDRGIKCGQCKEDCSFKTMKEVPGGCRIDSNMCDICGNCIVAWPVDAIKY